MIFGIQYPTQIQMKREKIRFKILFEKKTEHGAYSYKKALTNSSSPAVAA